MPYVAAQLTGHRAVLISGGLDTVVDAYLNGDHILHSENMHVQNRVDVTERLRATGGRSILELRFSNAPAFARSEMARIGYKGKDTDVHFGDPEQLFLRKAQYHWVRTRLSFVFLLSLMHLGVGLGPAINTAGPWRPIHLEVFQKRVDTLVVRQQVAADLKRAVISIRGTAESLGSSTGQNVAVEVRNPSEVLTYTCVLSLAESKSDGNATLTNPELWYPHLYGPHPLYEVTVKVGDSHSMQQFIRLRRLQLLQHHLSHLNGTAFVFEANNIRLFADGLCWIPDDFLLPRVTSGTKIG